MDEKHKINVNSPDTTFHLTQNDSMMLNPKIAIEDEDVINRLKGKTRERFSNTYDFLENRTTIDAGNKAKSDLKNSLKAFNRVFKPYLLYGVLCGIIVWLVMKPSGYSELIDEISILKREKNILENTKLSRNVLKATEGARVSVDEGQLYRYGLFRQYTSKVTNIMESTSKCLALSGTQGDINIELEKPVVNGRIAIYHPVDGNEKSALREFVVFSAEDITGKAKEYSFEYQGKGYQEFKIGSMPESLRIKIKNNHGEEKYTAIYRIMIFSE
ncbi:hypothetical protein ENBRE01_0280 [Enteropsectra breve]|nr:hypothetical protein ENBRE01_0280 [Enteropsectra breve]